MAKAGGRGDPPRAARTARRPTSLSVVIPVYNEQATILRVIERVRRAETLGLAVQLVVVDDGSTDGTRELLQALPPAADLVVALQRRNRGKGAVLRKGFELATGDLVLVQDADLEYDPADYPALLAPLVAGQADVVYGTRFQAGAHRVLFFWHYVANRGLTLLSDMLTNLNLTDMETGYKVFRREVLAGMRLRSERFGIEPELTAKVARGGWRVYEVPISYFGRDYSEGKKIGWRDGVVALVAIFRFRFFD